MGTMAIELLQSKTDMENRGATTLNGPQTPDSLRTPTGIATSNGPFTPNSFHHRLPHNRHHLNLSSTSRAHSVLDKLHWRERIRHYTWTFFTATMATGGISNVLYTGKFSL